MKARGFACASVFLMAASFGAHAFADDAAAAGSPAASDIRKVADAFQAKMADARKTGQFAEFQTAIQTYVALDCTFDENGSTHTYTEFLDQARQSLKHALTGATISTTKIDVTGSDAKETGRIAYSENFVDAKGQVGAKGLAHQLETDSNFYVHWLKTTDGWKAHYMSFSASRLLVDGKVYTPPIPKVKPQTASKAARSPQPAPAQDSFSSGFGPPVVTSPTRPTKRHVRRR